MPSPFEQSLRKIARAKAQAADLERHMREFFDGNPTPYSVVIEPDPNCTEQEVHKIRFTSNIPNILSDLASEAVHNLRSALDNAGYQLAVAGGVENPQHCAFPFSGSADKFEDNMRGRCKDIPKSILPVFRGCQPYRGGDGEFLWALNEISIADKHKFLAVGVGLAGSLVSGEMASQVSSIWDRSKHEVELARVARHGQFKCDFALFVVFDHVPVVAGKPVVQTIEFLAHAVEMVLAYLEGFARESGLFY